MLVFSHFDIKIFSASLISPEGYKKESSFYTHFSPLSLILSPPPSNQDDGMKKLCGGGMRFSVPLPLSPYLQRPLETQEPLSLSTLYYTLFYSNTFHT